MSNHSAPKPLINDAISITENHAHHGVTTVKTLNTTDDNVIINTLLNRSYNFPERKVGIVFMHMYKSEVLVNIKLSCSLRIGDIYVDIQATLVLLESQYG